MKNSLLAFLGLALLLSVALPLHAQDGCATSIGVGPNSRGLTDGTPWITGCTPDAYGNYTVYQMQTGGAWVEMQEGVGGRIAVSPDKGIAWAISHPL